jgi:ferrous iron transport protein B
MGLKQVMLVGNPNSGKSSIFHGLTHAANFKPEVQEGNCIWLPEFQFIDCPGFYSLTSGQSTSLAMQFGAQELLNNPPHLILNVINANELERQLLLSSQLIELGIPMVVVLTHLDKLSTEINTDLLEKLLGVPVYALDNYESSSIQALSSWLQVHQDDIPVIQVQWPEALKEIFGSLSTPSPELFALRRYLESVDVFTQQDSVSDDLYKKIANIDGLDQIQDLDVELLMMDARFKFVHHIASLVVPVNTKGQQKLTRQLDKILLHRFWGWPIFLLILWAFFSLAIDIGGSLQQTLTGQCEWFFKNPVTYFLSQLKASHWLHWLVVDGIGTGVSTMLSFLPVMAFMNLFLILLEASGYMSRVAFLFERMMRKIGLPGKAFLPLLIGFGCNVPAIMSARMVEGSKERLLTVLLSPFMSCSARLTIYAVFASLFFPQSGGLIVLSLYLLGIVMAILTGLLLRKFWLTGHAQPLMMELPLYKVPNFKRLMRDVYIRLKLFLIRSGALVIPFCAVLGTAQAAFQNGWVISAETKNLLWSVWQHVLHPIFSPIGIGEENWPAAVSLITGTMAKEIVVATLNTLYSQMPNVLQPIQMPALHHPWVMFQQFMVLPTSMTEHLTAYSSRALMWAFGGPIAAYSYLLFVLLYIPCISTLAIIRQEVGHFWQWFAFIWSLVLAYSVASLFYQTATFFLHPLQSMTWWVVNVFIWTIIIMLFHHWKPKHARQH